MRQISALSMLVALMLFALPGLVQADSTVQVTNYSDWTIMEFYLAPVHSDDWGEDLLGQQALDPGEVLTLSNIACDNWDILVVDDEGYECVLEDIDLCGDRAVWNITNEELEVCVEETDQ